MAIRAGIFLIQIFIAALVLHGQSAQTAEIDRWSVSSADDLISVFAACYESRDIDCMMDLVYTKGVPNEQVSKLLADLEHFVATKPISEISRGINAGYHNPKERVENFIRIRPSLPPIDGVVFWLGEPDCSPASLNTVTCHQDQLPFWVGEEQRVLYLVVEERWPPEFDQEVLEAIILDYGERYPLHPFEVLEESIDLFPGHSMADHYRELGFAFSSLLSQRLVLICKAPKFEERPDDCQDLPSSEAREVIKGLNFSSYAAENTQPYFFTVTDAAIHLCENRACRDRVDEHWQKRTELPVSAAPFRATTP